MAQMLCRTGVKRHQFRPGAAVPMILAAEQAGDQENGWIRWMATDTRAHDRPLERITASAGRRVGKPSPFCISAPTRDLGSFCEFSSKCCANPVTKSMMSI